MPPLDTLSLAAQVLAEARLMTNMEQDDGITCCSPRHHHHQTQKYQHEVSDSSFRKLLVKPRDYIDDDSEGRDAIVATAATRECLLYKNNHHHPTNPSSSSSSSSILPTHKKSNMLRGLFITTALSLTLLHLWHLPITLSTSVAGVWMSPITNRLVEQQQQQPPARPSIVLFGDSLTQQGFGTHGTIGWASLLASDYARRADVLNRGYSGYNTKMALQVWPSIRTVFGRSSDASSSVLFTTVFFGANDAVVPGTQQHVPLNEYRDNIETIVDNMQSAWTQQQQQQAKDDDRESRITHQKVIFLVTPPPVDEQAWAAFRNSKQQQSSGVAPNGVIPHPPGTNRFNHVTNQYAQVVRDIVKERQNSRQDHPAVAAVALVDAWEILEGHNVTAYSQYLSDGLHLNERGNRKLYQGFMDLIQREYPWLAPDTSTNGENEGVPLEEKAWYEYD